MLDFALSPSNKPVTITRGYGDLVTDEHERFMTGLTDDNCILLECGDTHILLAQERGEWNDWQVVFDHVETWAEALKIWQHLQKTNTIRRVRAYPSPKLSNLGKVQIGAAARAMERAGWTLDAGAEWIITRREAEG